MKAILEFELPQEKEEHDCALNGHLFKIVLQDTDQWLRNMAKYEDKESVQIDEVRQKIRELLADYDLPIL